MRWKNISRISSCRFNQNNVMYDFRKHTINCCFDVVTSMFFSIRTYPSETEMKTTTKNIRDDDKCSKLGAFLFWFFFYFLCIYRLGLACIYVFVWTMKKNAIKTGENENIKILKNEKKNSPKRKPKSKNIQLYAHARICVCLTWVCVCVCMLSTHAMYHHMNKL